MLRSAVFPGIETVIYNERHEFFKMPLEARTIKAMMRNMEENVRSNESDLSHISERIVHVSSEAVYWDPKEVQLGTRIAKMKGGSSPYLARIAPLQALLSRGPEQCLELIESSRTHFWTRLLRLQTTFEGLPETLARQLEDTAHELDACKSQSIASVSKQDMRWQFELESKFSRLLGDARKIPGFGNLLRPKGYEELLEASVGGPVIVLMGDTTYAALVVTTKGVNSVFLPDLTSTCLSGLQSGLNRENATARGSLREQVDDGELEIGRGGRPKERPQPPSYEPFLARLWDLVVKPIFEFMGFLSSVCIHSSKTSTTHPFERRYPLRQIPAQGYGGVQQADLRFYHFTQLEVGLGPKRWNPFPNMSYLHTHLHCRHSSLLVPRCPKLLASQSLTYVPWYSPNLQQKDTQISRIQQRNLRW